MSKKDVLRDIEKIIKKKADIKKTGGTVLNKSIEDLVLDFFNEIEASRRLHNNNKYSDTLVQGALEFLEKQIKKFDPGAAVTLEQNINYDNPNNEGMIRGITIWWSAHHIRTNQCDPSIYFDYTNILIGIL